MVSGLLGEFALYRWPWKLVASDPPQLFQILEDPLERRDLSAEFPEVAEDLQARLAAWPMAEPDPLPLFDILFDPDTFGGEEDGRPPWPDAVLDR